MSDMKIELNYDGIGKLLKSSEALGLCESYASRYDGDMKSFIGFDRAHAIVYEENEKKGKK